MRPTRWFALLLVACDGSTKDDDPADVADTDTDADSDTDSDADGDTDTGTVPLPDADGDGVADDIDCDDADNTVFPGAPDVCGDDRVTDCDRTSDDGLITVDGVDSFTSLGPALAQSSAGSTVLVCPGTYTGAFASQDPVNLLSYGGRDVTILDGNEMDTVLGVPAGTTLTGFTVTHGKSFGGGGIVQTSSGTLTITSCRIVDNEGSSGGGVSTSTGSQVTISDTTISGNVAEYGGGLYVDAGTTVDLTGSTLEANDARMGGGAFVLDGAILGGVVFGNLADDGGGITTLGDVSLTDVEIADNNADAWGGGIAACRGPSPCQGGSLSLVGVSVHDNFAENGGGIEATATEIALDDTSEVRANVADYDGGGVYMDSGTLTGGVVSENHADYYGGGVGGNSSLAIVGVEIRDNTCSTYGAGVGVFGPVTITGGSIVGNVASIRGGGIFTEVGPVDVTDVVITDNQADEGAGLCTTGAPLTVTNCSVLRNTAGSGGGALVSFGNLASVSTDWGEGADDNVPSDVSAGAELVGYGANETFDCIPSGCTPLP